MNSSASVTCSITAFQSRLCSAARARVQVVPAVLAQGGELLVVDRSAVRVAGFLVVAGKFLQDAHRSRGGAQRELIVGERVRRALFVAGDIAADLEQLAAGFPGELAGAGHRRLGAHQVARPVLVAGETREQAEVVGLVY